MKFRTTIILLIIAGIGAAYIFLYDKKQYRTDVWVQRQQMVLPDYKPGQINKIEMKKGDTNIVLESTGNENWRMVEPLQLRADKAEVAEILAQFEFLRKIGVVKESETANFSLKEYGLETPGLVVSLWLKKGSMVGGTAGDITRYTVNIGDRLAAGQDTVYITVGDDKDVSVVGAKFLEKVNKGINDLRNKWAFEYDKHSVERVRLESGENEPVVCSKAEQLWWITQPLSDRADTERIQDILNELKNLKIAKEDFVSDSEEDIINYGLDKPVFSISIGTTDNVQTLHLGHRLDEKVYAKLDGESSIFLVHDIILRDLDLELNDFRDKQLLRFDAIGTYGIEKIDMKTPDSSLVMEKTVQYDWMIKSPKEILADRDTVREFVEKIKDLQIQQYVDDSGENFEKYGLADSPIEVSVFRRIGEGETVKFFIGNADENGGLCYVRRDGEDAVYTVPTENFYEIAKAGYLAFRDKLVMEFPKETARKIVIERDGKTLICETAEDSTMHRPKWNMVSPVAMEAELDSINQVVWNLSFLMADKIVTLSAENLDNYGLDKPLLKASVTYEASDMAAHSAEVISEKSDLVKPKELKTKTLLIGNKVEPEKDKSNYYAKVNDQDMVFQVGWTDVRDYSIELVTRELFSFDSTNAKSIKIIHPEKELLFQKNEEHMWQMIKPEVMLLSGNLADRIISSLKLLRGESIVQYSNKDLSKYGFDNPQFTITINLDEADVLFLVGKEAGNDYYVTGSETNFVYLMNKNKIEELVEACVVREIQ
ncbi:MAG: DUF4340 domain-containing protein [Candidatus Scalindua rubra]|uniref:DUF4340 domain-containing protein n=1 Tax=Candidatus Scalindua brodae TaxID=237368 RepID=A0A0B0EJ51_9BACT|nr:MAG: hypothetical protein SCABRO_02222 [Candidatus Scalindua brodae]MBZ0107710.1 DUF4340 domain-containing protein [Candidatus Scalindua rubra]TWU35532.1 hypothetical protein S225a_08960 [Candidatus Brocadiaceae bacterium S225]